MQPRNYIVKVDLTGTSTVPRIGFTKGDIGGSLISFSVFINDKPEPLIGKIITITIKKSDGVNVVYNIPEKNIHDNIADFYPDLNGLNVPGVVLFTFEIYDGLSRITSNRMQYTVIDSLNVDDDVTSFKDYPILSELINKVQTANSTETIRQEQEKTRIANELTRQQSEANRVTEFNSIKEVLNQTSNNGTIDLTAEINRQEQEKIRVANELVRQQNETDRINEFNSIKGSLNGDPSTNSNPLVNYVRLTIQTALFHPLVELINGSTSTVSWICEETGTIFTGLNPDMDFKINSVRHIRLKATILSDIVTLNLGFNHREDAPGDSPSLGVSHPESTLSYSYDYPTQSVSSIENINLLTNLIRFMCNSGTLNCALDFTDMSQLTNIELYGSMVTSVNLTGCTSLRRLCLENNNMTVFDLNPVADSLYDLRGSGNGRGHSVYFMPLTKPMTHLWHWCTQSETIIGHASGTQLPAIEEWWDWRSGQTGSLVIRSSAIRDILSYSNGWSSVDVENQFPVGRNGRLDLGSCQIASVNLSKCPGLTQIYLQNNKLNQTSIDAILNEIDSWGTLGGTLNLGGTGNSGPTNNTVVNKLMARGWTVTINAAVGGSGTTTTDITPPSDVTNLITSSISTTSVSLSWVASSSTDVASYDVYNGTSLVGNTTGTTYNVTGLSASTNYTFTVKSRDLSGNVSAGSIITITTTQPTPDTTPPSDVTNITTSEIISTGLTLSWSTSNSPDIASYDIYNGETLIGNVTNTTYKVIGLTPSTNYTLTIKAKDISGNISAGSTVNVTTPEPPTSGSIIWEDTFDRSDVTGTVNLGNDWNSYASPVNSAQLTGDIVSNDLVLKTVGSGYSVLYNMANSILPVDYTVSTTIPANGTVNNRGTYWGLVGRWYNKHGVSVFWDTSNNAAFYADAYTYYDKEVGAYDALTLTYPSNWTDGTIEHTVAMKMEGTNITVILDEQIAGTFTSSVNAMQTGTGVGFNGEGQSRHRSSITVTAN